MANGAGQGGGLARESVLEVARRALEIEIAGIAGLRDRLGPPFESAVDLLLACKGKVVVTGVGKSGHIAHKIAATLASTGTPAFYLHPAEAVHGDLGMVQREDLVLALSNSGATEELLRLLGPLRRMGITLIAMTGNPDSELAKRSELNLDVGVAQEACPLGLAPTASTTAALAMGDALAVSLLHRRGFRAEDYALFHPGGSLGKQLMTTVGDLMEGGDRLPAVQEHDTVSRAVEELQAKRWGLTGVVDAQGALSGAFSMGDLTRLHLADPTLAFVQQPVGQHMNREPKAVPQDMLAARALNRMEQARIRAMFVVDAQNRPVGILGLYEVLQAIDY